MNGKRRNSWYFCAKITNVGTIHKKARNWWVAGLYPRYPGCFVPGDSQNGLSYLCAGWVRGLNSFRIVGVHGLDHKQQKAKILVTLLSEQKCIWPPACNGGSNGGRCDNHFGGPMGLRTSRKHCPGAACEERSCEHTPPKGACRRGLTKKILIQVRCACTAAC